MALNVNQINEIVQKPKYKAEIGEAVQHEARLRIHAETIIDNYAWHYAFSQFLNWVDDLLPADKFLIFKKLIQFPLKSTELCADIFTEFERIFDAKNPIFSWEFTSKEYAEDFEHYRTEVLKEQEIWRNDGFQALKTMINSIVVVDMPAQGTTPPEPYFYFLDISNVLDCEFTIRPDDLEYLIFRLDSDDPEENNRRIACFDDESYKILQLRNSTYEIESESPHNLGYCPAKFFYSRKMRKDNPILRESEISKALTSLDWYNFQVTSKKYADLYVSWPIYSMYEQECDYKESDGSTCDGGYIRKPDGSYGTKSNLLRKCPACSDRNIIGVGTVVTVPAPRDGEDVDMRDPVQRLDADVDSMKYNTGEIERIASEIFFNCAGEVRDVTTEQAKNELQVKSQFEDRKNVLIRIKKNFDIVHKFTTDTICKLRYGSNFINSTINYGNDYFLRTSQEYFDVYSQAKKSGATDSELEVITENRINVEYRDNKEKVDRIKILKDLEPFQHRTTSELTEFARIKPDLISDELFIIKLNFTTFIARFESENGSIVEFGSAIDYSKKLQTITKTLKSYANEQIKRPDTRDVPST